MWRTTLRSAVGPKSVLAQGVPDLLLNNAALINRNAPLWQVPADEFDRVVDVNIKGVANVIRHFVPAMIEARRGVIVNFSSGWGRSTSPEVAPVLRHEICHRGTDQGPGPGVAQGHGRRAAQPGHHQYRDAAKCIRRQRGLLSRSGRMGRRGRPFLLALGPADNGRSLSIAGIDAGPIGWSAICC